MNERIALVTGASSGIGYETALGLARAGYRVGLVGRDHARTEAAAARIRAETGAEADAFVADLSSQAAIARLAAEVLARYPRLDRLVNNAGALFTERAETVDGIERSWALDHLAYVQLTLALLPRLRASAPARIVNLASAAHAGGTIALDDLDGRRGYRGMRAYSQAKLGNLLFTYALDRRLAGSGVTVNAVHPGVIASGFGAGATGLVGLLLRLARPLMRSTEEGAKTSLRVALAPELAGVGGRYFDRSGEVPSSARSRDRALQEAVWRASLDRLGLPEPG